MSSLAIAAYAVGGALVLSGVFGLLAPDTLRRAARAFPRSRLPGWLLITLDLAWVSWIIHHAALGRFEPLKPALYVVAPLSLVAIVFLMDELLAPRALGGLLLLLANPVLNAARWHPSDWRLVMTVIAYVWAVAGMVFVLSPFRFRHLAEWATKTNARVRLLALVRLVVGAGLGFLGWGVY